MELPDMKTPGPDKTLEGREKIEEVRRVISMMPSHQRAALLLSTFENFSYAQIAEQIGKSESSVKSLIHRARRQLAAEIGTG
jgi:RNA polymerase sigma-70 factor (ECF subfamily)